MNRREKKIEISDFVGCDVGVMCGATCIMSATCICDRESNCLSNISEFTLHSSLLIADNTSLASPGISSEEDFSCKIEAKRINIPDTCHIESTRQMEILLEDLCR